MRTASRPLNIKAANEEEGTFEAIVSVFGNVDAQGDEVVRGAFDATLAKWKASGDPTPVVWSHQHIDPHAYIGSVEDAAETDEGLWVKAKLDLDTPNGAQVHRLLRARRIKQFS